MGALFTCLMDEDGLDKHARDRLIILQKGKHAYGDRMRESSLNQNLPDAGRVLRCGCVVVQCGGDEVPLCACNPLSCKQLLSLLC